MCRMVSFGKKTFRMSKLYTLLYCDNNKVRKTVIQTFIVAIETNSVVFKTSSNSPNINKISLYTRT